MLTVEELKALEVGDWVWFVDTCDDGTYCNGCYRTVFRKLSDYVSFKGQEDLETRWYESYGKQWIAFKNKEEAEGRSISLPCKVSDTAYFISTEFGNAKIKETKIEKLVCYGDFWLVFFYDTFNFSRLDINGKAISIPTDSRLTFLTKIEAEKRLKELKNNS